jgi:hypothetical protein
MRILFLQSHIQTVQRKAQKDKALPFVPLTGKTLSTKQGAYVYGQRPHLNHTTVFSFAQSLSEPDPNEKRDARIDKDDL